MKKFLFEQYGYYPTYFDKNEFILNGWIFKLIPTELTKENLESIENSTKVLNQHFYNKGPYLIKNKFNSNLSTLDQTNYVLVSVYNSRMNFEDLLKFHSIYYSENEFVDLDKILIAWKERIDEVEKKINSHLRIDSIYYKHNLDVSMFCIGLAINAMQYLSDIIHNYDNKLYGVTVVHKRLSNLDSFDFFNPLNFIVEHPIKDFSLLYQNDYISFDELSNLLGNYSLDIKSATFFLARLLYRVDVFDFIEAKRNLDEGDKKIDFNIDKEMYKIKKAYNLLKNIYSIRPIDWLEENL